MPYREDPNLILNRQEAVEGDITRFAIRNHEFAQFALDDATD